MYGRMDATGAMPVGIPAGGKSAFAGLSSGSVSAVG